MRRHVAAASLRRFAGFANVDFSWILIWLEWRRCRRVHGLMTRTLKAALAGMAAKSWLKIVHLTPV